MRSRRRTALRATLLATLALLLVATGALANERESTYEITITNLTGGQPFSPPVLVTHRAPASLFHVGEPASTGIQQIAENGNNGPLLASVEGNPRFVYDVQEGSFPLVPAGTPGGQMFPDSATYVITAGYTAKYLSIAMMLVCTNDGFTGLDSLPIPGRVGRSITVYAHAYDAGTEINTEDFADIVPPCQGLIGVTSDDPGTGESNPELAEGGVVAMHAGIAGGVDLLPEVHGWSEPVAMITITRVD
jgi:hypothetical protein